MTTNTAGAVSEEMVERVAKGIANAMRNHIDDSHAYWRCMGEDLRGTYRSMAAAALGVSGWRPIEELPESNVPVLATIQRVGGRRVVIRATYVASKTVLCDEISCGDDFGEYDEDQDCYWCPEGWYEWNECEEVHWAVSDKLVGWQHLPPPATEDSA